MKLKALLLLFLLFSATRSTIAQKFEWLKKMEEITLLQSTHADVVRLFGEPRESNYPYHREFIVEEGKLIVQYSTGLCGVYKKKGWNVPKLTVTEIRFKLKTPLRPADLKIDFQKFDAYEIYDVPNAFIYSNDALGIKYFKSAKGKIESVTFYPPERLDYLYCRE